MAKVYTRTGDKGKTSLYTGERVSKASLRVETYGTVDEADSVLGLARAFAVHDKVKDTIYKVQKELWLLMADIASIGKDANIQDAHVTAIEETIDAFDSELEPLNHFLVPGDAKSAAALDMARSVIRRAERLMWKLGEEEDIHESDLKYLNRLSDLCFILSRYETEVK
jgi:cob(I)alamin adenosyltransferase